MRRKYNNIIISFLIFFVASLGTSFAGSPVCPPKCPDCVVVPACCADTAGDQADTTSGAADHSAKQSGCNHDGICFVDFQPIDVSVTISTIEYETAFVQLPLSLAILTNQVPKEDAPIFIRPTIKSITPLFLRNCSFLI